MTWACHNGLRDLTTPSRRSGSNTSFWDDTSPSISAFGTGMPSPYMFGKYCWTRALFPGPISSEKGSRLW